MHYFANLWRWIFVYYFNVATLNQNTIWGDVSMNVSMDVPDYFYLYISLFRQRNLISRIIRTFGKATKQSPTIQTNCFATVTFILQQIFYQSTSHFTIGLYIRFPHRLSPHLFFHGCVESNLPAIIEYWEAAIRM